MKMVTALESWYSVRNKHWIIIVRSEILMAVRAQLVRSEILMAVRARLLDVTLCICLEGCMG